METWSQLNFGGPYLWCFVLSIISALVPWVNGEILLLSLTAVVHTPGERGLLVLAASAGQMAGKCILYWAGKGVIPLRWGRVGKAISTWKDKFEKSSSKMLSLVFVSSALGIPPFFVVTLLAGVFRVRFGPFFTVGACGRLVRFSAVAFIPWMMVRWFR